MDPNVTYGDMIKAFRDGEIETARERAIDLAEWLARGGFPPAGVSVDTARTWIVQVLAN